MDKGALAILIGKMKPGGAAEPDGDEAGGDMYREGLVTTAAEIREALESKDDEALADALQSFVTQCDAMPHKEGEHEED